MKKTFLATILATTSVMYASGTKGSVEFFNVNYLTNTKNSNKLETEFKVNEIGIKTNVQVLNTGLSFGGVFKGKGIKIPIVEDIKNKFLNNSSAYINYKLPEMGKVNTQLRAELLNIDNKNKFNADISLGADVNYTVSKGVKVGLNSNTVVPLNGKVYTTNKIYIDANTDKLKLDTGLELRNSYDDKDKVFKYVKLNANAKYLGIKDLEIEGKFNYIYVFNNLGDNSNYLYGRVEYTDLFRKKINELKDYENLNPDLIVAKSYSHSYELGLKKYIDKSFIKLEGLVQSQNNQGNLSLQYGAELSGEYKQIQNLTLKGNLLVEGARREIIGEDGSLSYETGVYLKLGAKYDYAITDKFVLMPEISGYYGYEKTYKEMHEIILTPKLGFKYTPIKNLEILSSVAVPVNFTKVDDKKPMQFDRFDVKSSLNIKYTW